MCDLFVTPCMLDVRLPRRKAGHPVSVWAAWKRAIGAAKTPRVSGAGVCDTHETDVRWMQTCVTAVHSVSVVVVDVVDDDDDD